MGKTLIVQLKLPEEVNKKLRIEGIQQGLSLKEMCVKVLTDHANK